MDQALAVTPCSAAAHCNCSKNCSYADTMLQQQLLLQQQKAAYFCPASLQAVLN